MKISIGTLSRAFNLSDEALRFYEKKGLLKPSRENGTGYRTFERADIQRVSNIRRLKNQNFSLEEIRDVYYCIDESQLLSLYSQKAADTRREILYQQHILSHMDRTISTLENVHDLLGRPQIADSSIAYLLEYPSIEAMWAQLPKNPVLKSLFHQLPLTSFTTLLPRARLDGAPGEMTKGVLFFEDDAEVLDMDLSQFRRIDASRSVTCLFRLENGQFDPEPLLGIMQPFMKEHHLRASDDLFTAQLLSYINGEELPVHYAQLIIPVTDE